MTEEEEEEEEITRTTKTPITNKVNSNIELNKILPQKE